MSMTDDQIERCDALWRALADTARVRWMPGMLARNTADADHPLQRILRRFGAADTRVWIPVWADHATIGCLVAMAREATGDAKLHCHWCGVDLVWRAVWFLTASDCCGAIGGTEPEALLRAILAPRGER